MMSGMPLETCWAFNKFWNNKFYYKVVSCWSFLLIHTAMHGSMNIRLSGHSVPTQPWQLPVTICAHKPEAANKLQSSWWWAVCRSKYVEPLKKLWNNKFYYKAASCLYFYWLIYDARIHEYQIYLNIFHGILLFLSRFVVIRSGQI
jgi:hypothetical protein